MKKVKYLVILIAAVSLASCGVIKKDCGCPHFGKVPAHTKPVSNIS
jgi:hypothetical protein